MTAREALGRVRDLRPSQYGDEVLLGWLGELEGRLWEDVMSASPDAPPRPAALTREEMDAPLLLSPPHDGLYELWLGARIDLQNGELDRYNNDMRLVTALWQAFADQFTRTHSHRRTHWKGGF